MMASFEQKDEHQQQEEDPTAYGTTDDTDENDEFVSGPWDE